MEKYDREKHCGFGEPIWDTSDVTDSFAKENKNAPKEKKQ